MAFNQSERDWDDTTVDLLGRYWQESELGTWRVSLARKNRAPMYLERYGWLPIGGQCRGLRMATTILGMWVWTPEDGMDCRNGY